MGFFTEGMIIVNKTNHLNPKVLFQNEKMFNFEQKALNYRYLQPEEAVSPSSFKHEAHKFKTFTKEDLYPFTQRERPDSLWNYIIDQCDLNERIIFEKDEDIFNTEGTEVRNFEYVVELRQKEVVFDSQCCIITVINDISQAVGAEKLRQQEKLTDVMIASTSHDMKTPINSALQSIQVLENKITDAS